MMFLPNARIAVLSLPVFTFSVAMVLCNGAYAEDNLQSTSGAVADNLSSAERWKATLFPFYDDGWSLYFGGTAIYQGYPSFHAAYNGVQSLPSRAAGDNLEVASFYLGRKLWQGAALYIDPQFYRGFGLNGTIGMAGFPDGEANKGGTSYIYPELARVFLRQEFNFGGATETLPRGPNQVHETLDASRLTVTVGKFSPTDDFDGNAYSHNPETQFMNWSFMDSLAWDWAQDSHGYSWGASFALNQKNWTLRYEAMIPVNEINGDRFRLHGGNELDHTAELEERHAIAGRPGRMRFLAFYNREIAGDFDEALRMGGNINDAIAHTREYGRVEYGFALNGEQQLADDLGAFARLSWNNGQIENYGFTQADESAAAGLSLRGKSWRRPDDVAGLAFAVNGISNRQKEALAQGYTTGLIIGDGQLSYSGESIVETYYNFKLLDGAFLGPDYQFVANPAYNSARGPVSIFAFRLHVDL